MTVVGIIKSVSKGMILNVHGGLRLMKLKNGQELIISKAQVTDAGKIIEYLNIVGGESDNLLFGKNEFHMTVEDEERFIENLSGSRVSALFIGKINGEIACVGSMMSPGRKRIAHGADLAISVKKQYWGVGVGSLLMSAIIDFAKENKQTEILHLGVRADNEAAIGLYKKMGFREIGRYKNFFKFDYGYRDEVLMNLYLYEEDTENA